MWEYCADERDRRVVSRAKRQREVAAYAHLNWKLETAALIVSEMKEFSSRGHGRWAFPPPLTSATTVQADLYTDSLFPANLGSIERAPERPASLVYSLHPNGSVAVVASPHTSEHAASESRHYIIDVVPHPWALAGIAGRERVRRHLRTFGKLATLTRTEALPTSASGRFMRRLVERGDRFASAFPSSGDARRHRLSQEANLGIGLIAGLIASTIWPFARDFGVDAGKRATLTITNCKEGFSDGPRLARCLSDGSYWLDRYVENTLSTGNMLLFALVLTTASLWMLWRIKHQR